MKKLILLLIISAFAAGAHAFVKEITCPSIAYNNMGMSLVTESPGVFALIGDYQDPTYSYSGFVARLDSSGNSLTVNITPFYDFYDAIKTASGYAALAYFTDPSYNYSAELVIMDATGNCTSVRKLSDGDFNNGGICATADNGIVAGVDESGPGQDQIFMERFDSSGNCVWAKSYDYYAWIYKITAASDGGFFAAGQGPLYGPFVIKVDSSGNELWVWEDVNQGRLYNMTAAENGSVIAAGYSGVPGDRDVLAVKLSAAGSVVWKKEIDLGCCEFGNQVIPAAGERIGYILSGIYYNTSGGYNNMFAMQVDASGNTGNFKGIPALYAAYNGFSAPLSADRFLLAGVDDTNRIITADYAAAAYASAPVPGGSSSGDSYACPQPAKDFVRFVYALSERATVKINIYNFANRLVGQNVSQEIPGDNVTTEVDTSKLSSGVYFYQIVQEISGKAAKRLKTGEFIIKK